MNENSKTSGTRLLIVKMSSLGDLFHALPTVHSLKTGLNATVDWVVNSEYTDTVSCFSDVATAISFPRRNVLQGQRKFLQQLRSARYDIAVDLQGLLKSAYVAQLAKAERRIGPSFCREGAHLLYSEIAGEKNRNRHAVNECLDVVRYLGLKPDETPPPIEFPKYKDEIRHPAIAFAPASRWSTKNWPVAHFIETGLALQNECNATIYLVGGPSDRELCDRIAGGLGSKTVNTAGSTNIPEVGGLLQDVDLLISVDSGPVHIAAALQTPVLGLYGITDPMRTGPHGDMHRIIRAPLQARRHGDFRKPTPRNMAIMQSIESQLVVKNAKEMLAKKN